MGDLGFRTVGRNALALYISRAAIVLVPLITIPYLARVLRPDALGVMFFALAMGLWLSMMVAYGFQISATREIARRREDREAVADIVAGVVSGQLLLVVATAVVALVATLTVPTLRADPVLGFLAWAIGAVSGLVPRWYYLGIERMRLPATLDVISRVLVLILLLLLVDGPEDVWLVLAIYAGAPLVATIYAFVPMYREVPWRMPRLSNAIKALRMGAGMFLFVASDSLFTTANAFLLGLFAPFRQVGFYGVAERFSNAALGLLEPISQAIFPFQSKLVTDDPARARKVARLALFVIGAGGLVGGLLLAGLAPWIIGLLLGPGYDQAVPVLRVLAILLPISAVSNVLGFQWMLPLGLDRPFMIIFLSAGFLNVLLVAFLAPRFGAIGAAASFVVVEALIVGAFFFVLSRRGLNPLSSSEVTT